MEYVMGLDGGGTKTKLIVSDLEGNILGSWISGPSNLLANEYQIVQASIQDVIKEAIGEMGCDLKDCKAICIGAAGAGRENVREMLKTIIVQLGYNGSIIVTHDAQTALVGGIAGEEGILLSAGTGTICYGRTKEGASHRVSGWGHIIGDEGSAYNMGVEVLNAVMRDYDGRGKKTLLTNLVLKNLNLASPEELIEYIYSPNTTKKDIASYAIMVDVACQENDTVALEIVEKITKALVECVDAVLKILDFGKNKIKLVINGSVLTNNHYVRNQFKNTIANIMPQVELCEMRYDAAYGAVLIALENIKNGVIFNGERCTRD